MQILAVFKIRYNIPTKWSANRLRTLEGKRWQQPDGLAKSGQMPRGCRQMRRDLHVVEWDAAFIVTTIASFLNVSKPGEQRNVRTNGEVGEN